MHPNTRHPHATTTASGATPGAPQEPAPAMAAQPGKLIRLPTVESLTGLKRSSIYGLMRARTFPGSVRLSVRAVAWRESEVLAWCAERTKTGGANV
ncbi:MAG: AlpA family transcriptional regulator [Acidovorax soli]|uniref:AlpA family transcriptional regulator n=1 Tax=Acidovorax soli TaxID=592050 RepID=UPI0026EDA3EA|nr:AlpA family transcriptional regulator [Acidovorax soli]MCM2346121.1 AlpA family transcriptional regulator [Acidovorax soli]